MTSVQSEPEINEISLNIIVTEKRGNFCPDCLQILLLKWQ